MTKEEFFNTYRFNDPRLAEAAWEARQQKEAAEKASQPSTGAGLAAISGAVLGPIAGQAAGKYVASNLPNIFGGFGAGGAGTTGGAGLASLGGLPPAAVGPYAGAYPGVAGSGVSAAGAAPSSGLAGLGQYAGPLAAGVAGGAVTAGTLSGLMDGEVSNQDASRAIGQTGQGISSLAGSDLLGVGDQEANAAANLSSLGSALGGSGGLAGAGGMAGSLGMLGPLGLAGLALSFGGFKSGKHKDQKKRDAGRENFKKYNIIDDNYNITNADGSTFDIGRDGGEPYYNVGYGNDDYVGLDSSEEDVTKYIDENYGQQVGLAQPLALLMSGGDKKLTSDMTGYLVNAASSSGDFNENMKKYFADSGITKQQAHDAIVSMAEKKDWLKEDRDAYLVGLNQLFGE